MARGGYQRPSNPAPASGPGAMSQRTDGGPGQGSRYMSGGDYGEGQEMMTLQQGASMANSAAQTPNMAAAPARPMRQAPDLSAPTDRPDEPLTMGSPVGPGSGPEALSGGFGAGDAGAMDAQQLAVYLPQLIRQAADPDAPEGFKRFVRKLRNSNPRGSL